MFDRISIDSAVCHGQACIKGTRIPVHQIVSMLANGDTIGGLLTAYPHIQRADINAGLEYAATQFPRLNPDPTVVGQNEAEPAPSA
jgi:uncharacterized protein (DUF433 family)